VSSLAKPVLSAAPAAAAPQAAAEDARTSPVSSAIGPDLGDHFREAMSFLASGVVVVTASIDGRPWGMTVSSACPISVEPPTMMVSLNSRTALARAVAETGRFGVNVLGQQALAVARFASAPGQPKFLDAGLGLDLAGSHPASLMLEGSLGHVDCELTRAIEHETHTLFIGSVRRSRVGEPHPPLLHFRRTFHQLGEDA
jgi:flavin reductase (DIM6/NTAB) family NADH-FMN oxidoreductase RutF